MKEIFIDYNKALWNYIIFKNKKRISIVFSIVLDLILLSPILVITIKKAQRLEFILVYICFIIAYYFIYFILYASIQYPDKFIFKEVIDLCDYIDSFLGEGFTKFNDYIYGDNIPEFYKRIKLKDLPTKELICVWKYRLEERKTTYTLLLPFVAAFFLVCIEKMKDLIFIIGLDDIVGSYFGNDYIMTFGIILGLFKYVFILCVYIDKMKKINDSIGKVNLFIQLMN